MTRILAIDAGSVSAAWAIIDPENGLALTDDVPVADRAEALLLPCWFAEFHK